jgi:hypothetical protein
MGLSCCCDVMPLSWTRVDEDVKCKYRPGQGKVRDGSSTTIGRYARTEDSGDDKSPTKLQIMCDKTSIQPAPLQVDIS